MSRLWKVGPRQWLRPVGDYSSTYRYAPRYELPHRYDADGNDLGELPYNPATGTVDGRVFDAPYPTTFAAEELLVDQGSPALNAAHLKARVVAHLGAAGHVRLRLSIYTSDAVRCSWGETNITIPARSRTSGEIVIESEMVKTGAFPRAENVRVQEGDEPKMAFFGWKPGGDEGRGAPMFWLLAGSSNIRFVGCEFGFATDYTPNPLATSQNEGSRGFIFAGDTGVGGNAIQSAVDADYPYGITIERCSFHGALGMTFIRALRINAKRLAIKDNRITHLGNRANKDGQCLSVTSGSGPYLIENNHLSATFAENIMFGGGHSGSYAEVPQDIQIVDNYLEFPDDWKAIGALTKNLVEFKEADRALIQGNLFRGYDTLNGTFLNQMYAASFKVNADDSGGNSSASWIRTENITMRGNDFVDCNGWLTFSGQDNYAYHNPERATNRIEVSHNRLGVFKDGTLRPYATAGMVRFTVRFGGAGGIKVLDEPTDFSDPNRQLRDIDIHHNTIFGPYTTNNIQAVFVPSDTRDAPFRSIRIQANTLLLHPDGLNKIGYFRVGNGGGLLSAEATWTTMTDRAGSEITHNAICGVTSAAALIDGDIGYADIAAMGVDPVTGAPAVGSPITTADADGGALGADMALLAIATARAATGL